MRYLLLLLSLCSGCSWGPSGPCPPGPELFKPSTWVSKGGSRIRGGGSFAHTEVGAKTLVLEQREDNTAIVRITYQRRGKTVVETWTSVPTFGPFPWDKPNDIPILKLNDRYVNFGRLALGQRSMASVTVENQTRKPFSAEASVTGVGFVLDSSDCGQPGALPQCTVQIGFRPPSAGEFTGMLTVTSRLGNAVTAELSGSSVYPARLDASPDTSPPGDAPADSPVDGWDDAGGDVHPGG